MKTLLTMTMLAAGSAALPAIAGEAVTYSADGREFEGYLAKADDPKGAVVLIHDWDGLTDYEKMRADKLAEMGYSTFAVDIYGKGVRPTSPEANKAETQKLYSDRPMMVKLLQAGLAEAKEQGLGPAVVIGYCFGGAAAIELMAAKPEGVPGYATFHAGISQVTGLDFAGVDTPLRIYQGSADPAAPSADLATVTDKLTKAEAPFRLALYGGARHTFTVPGSNDYDEAADAASWSDFSDFLAETFR